MSNKEWPIQPSFLSLAKGENEEKSNFNEDGIYYPDYIRGFLADLSYDYKVRNTLSMFQVVPKGFDPIDENIGTSDKKQVESESDISRTIYDNYPVDLRIEAILKGRKIIRIDSGTFKQNEACFDGFRKCEGSPMDFCFKQDSRIGIFADSSFEKEVYPSDSYMENLKKVIDTFNKKEELDYTKLKLKECNGRFYVYYTCRASLLQENMFPIFANSQTE